MLDQRYSDNEPSRRDVPSFIEPRPPLIQNPFMRPRPQKGTNLLELFEEDSEIEEPELVQVYLRLKPCNVPNNMYEIRSDKCLVTSMDTTTAGHGRRTQHNVSRMYTFSHIFGANCNQKEVFDHVVKENLKKLPEGQNFTLLTYGASGSGKTYTLMGTVGSPGLVPRSLEYVFKLVDAAQQPLYKPSDSGSQRLGHAQQDFELQWVKRLRHVSAPLRDKYRRMSTQLCSDLTASSIDLSSRIKYYVWVSFVEIYNEAVYDLLAPPEKRTKMRIREDTNGNVYVKGLTQAFVRSGEEAYDVMVAGKHNLVVAATGVHAHSSRSHCIFTITMLTEVDGAVVSSAVRLCDLAGCERARATRNTGARMHESRAINSSLHVLERCLHTLRRKQRLVPYRESKLTRLLGPGLSGVRGEAVSMVVTLNPAPEYAHETRHVLTLACVARDIQINNTMLATTLESSAVDTTICSNAEVMKLRSDNERLHFEIIQAQSRNRELSAAMEERQQEAAKTMRELVEEAKDMTRQYYEAQMDALRSEMEDMIEEYECRLAKSNAPPKNEGAGTPSRFLQSKVAQLMTEIAILEEKLSAEQLARAVAEKEVQHLRSCIEERDEKAFKESSSENQEVILTDSEHESDDESDDPFNESLEPMFKKECLNKSQAVSIHKENSQHITEEDVELSDGDKSNDTLKNDYDETQDSVYATEDFSSMSKKFDDGEIADESSMSCTVDDTYDATNKTAEIDNESFNTSTGPATVMKAMANMRGTYYVEKKEQNNSFVSDELDKLQSKEQNNSCVPDEAEKHKSKEKKNSYVSDELEKHKGKEQNNSYVSDELEKLRSKEQNNCYVSDELKKLNPVRGTYCINDVDHEISVIKPSQDDFNTSKSLDVATEAVDEKLPGKVPEMLVNKIIKSLKLTQTSDSSLRQFEHLEMAAKTCEDSPENTNDFGNIKILKEKRNYFDDIKDVPDISNGKQEKTTYFDDCAKTKRFSFDDRKNTNELIVTKAHTEKKAYFDNIDVNLESAGKRKFNNIVLQTLNNDDRSPSIVKDEVGKDFEPTVIKKLLGESFAKPEILNSTKKALNKKHDSLDIFESPQLAVNHKELNNIEIARQSIENLVLEQKAHVKVANIKKEIKLEPSSSVEDPNNDNIEQNSTRGNNTMDEFETIYKDISAPRATEFELLVTQEIDTSNSKDDIKVENKSIDSESGDVKYNLRGKKKGSDDFKHKKCEIEEILTESSVKCESKAKPPKRNLRRTRKQIADSDSENNKLKDIVNLQNEFSDVTLDVPVIKKVTHDIPSPEKDLTEPENVPPLLGIQSCPAKSVTRSRRKLFTPRAEALEESMSQAGDSNERIYVPRPSYHRARARRKL